ncbi:MAG: hypothetical protein ACR2NR_04210 [Solirubrobacteraceae bacterium]
MRLRFTMLATALAAFAVAAVPSLASAAPHHNRALTIHLVPQSIIAGDEVDIIGQLKGADSANQPIVLYHRINPASQFSVISRTTTDTFGRYEFVRADGIVTSNRSWFVRGPATTHSRVMHEHVASSVSISPDPASGGIVLGTTAHPVVFSGHVTPDHTGQVVHLQISGNDGSTWRTISQTRLSSGSNYTIQQAFRTAGERDVRVVLPGDVRNTEGDSDAVSVEIQQTQRTGFSIQSSSQLIATGTSATISGVVDQPGSSNPDAGASVSLYAHAPQAGPYRLAYTTTTGTDGSYSFTVAPSTNEWYVAKLTYTPSVHSAQLFQGVQDSVSMTGPATATVDQHVEFTGSVTPDKSGHVIYLQKLGADSVWHTVEIRQVSTGSTFSFGWTFGAAGTKEFRARILGGPVNVGGVSQPVAVNVSLPPLSTLPTG